MKTKTIIFLLLTFNLSANKKSEIVKKEVVYLISQYKNISIKNKIILIAQCALESGHFKHYKYQNNIFGIKKRHSNKYASFNSIEECVTERIRIFNRKKHRFTKDYAPHNKNYTKLLNQVTKYVIKHYNLKQIM